jgi:hypothetical protein
MKALIVNGMKAVLQHQTFNQNLRLRYELMCKTLLIAAMMISVRLFLIGDIINLTLSSFGRQHLGVFFTWGLLTGCSFFLNSRYLCRKLQIDFRFLNIALMVCCSCVLITSSMFLGDSLLENVVHCTTAIIFGVGAFAIFLFILFYGMIERCEKGFKKYIIILIICAAIDLFFILFHGAVIISELFILISSQAVLYTINFLSKKFTLSYELSR